MEKFNGTHTGSTGKIVVPEITTFEGWNADQVELIKNTVCRGSTNNELKLFLYVATKTQLDPLLKQIFAVKRWDSKIGADVMQIQISIDGYRIIATRSGDYEGQLGPFWCGEDGKWVDVWTSKTLPFAAKVGIFKKGFREPLWSVARFDAYAQTNFDKKSGKDNLSFMWKKMPDLMIAKVAETLAIRRAFPMDLSGHYDIDEFNDSEQDTEIVPKLAKPDVNNRFLPNSTKVEQIKTKLVKTNFDDFVIPTGINTGKKISEVSLDALEKLLLGLRGLKSLTDDQKTTKETLESFFEETSRTS